MVMSSKKTLYLGSFKKGQYMSWFATTQALNKIIVKLYDDTTTYFDKSKKSINIDPPLAQGSALIKGNNLRIDIESVRSSELKLWHNTMDICTPNDNQVGEVFVLAGEDYIDDDYNDICISITAYDKSN
jgi:hypothetical protein